MKTYRNLLTLSLVIPMLTINALGAELTWDGGDGSNDNWSTGDNWDPSDSNLTTDDNVSFLNTDMGSIGTVNSIVDGNYSIGSLTFNSRDDTSPRDNQGHTLQIASDKSLTVNSLRVGSYPSNVPTYEGTNVEIQGGGTLTANGNVTVYNGCALNWTTDYAILDMRGLAQFTMDAPTGSLTLGANNYAKGKLYLAADNDITASYLNVGLNSHANPATSYLWLGQDNELNVNTVRIGTYRNGGVVEFEETLVDPQLVMRDVAGTGRVSRISVGDQYSWDGHSIHVAVKGTLDLSGGTADILVSNLYIGIGNYDEEGRDVETRGSLTLDAGTIDATDVRLGWVGDGVADGSCWTRATATLNGGTLIADTITVADDEASNHDRVTGTINLSGATIKAETLQKGDGNGTAVFNWDSGTIANKAGTDLTIGGGLGLTIDTAGEHAFDIETGHTASVNGVIAENSTPTGIVKKGGGTLYLNSDNIFTGAVTVNAGTLGGTGSVDGDVDMAGGTVYDWEASSADVLDLVTVDGTLFLEGTVTVNLLNTEQTAQTTPPSPNGFLLFSADTINTDNFDGWSVVLNDYWYSIGTTEVSISGGNVYLNGAGFIPEPTTFVLLALGGLGLLHRRRSRKP